VPPPSWGRVATQFTLSPGCTSVGSQSTETAVCGSTTMTCAVVSSQGSPYAKISMLFARKYGLKTMSPHVEVLPEGPLSDQQRSDGSPYTSSTSWGGGSRLYSTSSE